MKKAIILIGLFFLISNAGNAAQMKQFDAKSGKITYTITGNAKGSSLMFWDDYGYKKANFAEGTFKIMGISKEYRQIDVTIGPDKYEKKGDDGTVEKTENEPYLCWQKNQTEDIGKLTTAIMTEKGFKKAAKRGKVCGLDCSVWGKKETTMWIHQGLMMKMETSKFGIDVVVTATKIEKNIDVSEAKFKIPE